MTATDASTSYPSSRDLPWMQSGTNLFRPPAPVRKLIPNYLRQTAAWTNIGTIVGSRSSHADGGCQTNCCSPVVLVEHSLEILYHFRRGMFSASHLLLSSIVALGA